MTFLAEFDATADSPPAEVGVVIRWLRSDWSGMYAELRADRPILPTSAFTMITRATDVLAILGQPSLYSVRANRRSMDPAVGPFMLARDETDLNWQEKGLMQALLRWEDLPHARAIAEEVSQDAIARASDAGGAAPRLDIVPAIARAVPLAIVQRFFGFDAPAEAMLRWSFATQHGMFRNAPFDADVLARCHAAGQEMRAWLEPFLAGKRAAGSCGGDDTVSRLIEISSLPAAGLSADRVLSNVCGLLVGAIETSAQAIVQIVDQFLEHGDWRAAALAADAAGDLAGFDAHVFEALRFNPITTIQFRHLEQDRVLGEGTAYATPAKAGTVLAVCTGSAMFDPALMPDPERFDATRPPNSYLHFGMGHHECLGGHVARVSIPEAVRQILRLPGLARAAGGAGVIDFAGGPFPEHLTVTWSRQHPAADAAPAARSRTAEPTA
ncbi:cytochrome P450 [Cereibacter sphaeroides]|nr:cytochrome P450 [Cereibacter sphaeroides]AZB70100.1 cytochrome P450 [Cereibacter sphaeroides]